MYGIVYIPAAKAKTEKIESSSEAKTGNVKVVIFDFSGSGERSREVVRGFKVWRLVCVDGVL